MTENAIRTDKRTKDRKRQKYIRWMSSLAVTAGVAITAAFSPTPPEAAFLRLAAFGDSLLYETQVKDPEISLAEGDLWIRVEGAGTTLEEPLGIGTDAGGFTGLSPGREYAVAIVAQGSWTETVLAEETVITATDPGGGILSWELLPGGEEDFQQIYQYDVRTRIWDPSGIYSGIALSYATATLEDPQTFLTGWTEAASGTEAGTFRLDWVPPMNLIVFLKLTAEAPSGTVILDEVSFRTPTRFPASLYLRNATAESLAFSFWAEGSPPVPVVYAFTLWKEEATIDSRVLEPSPESGSQSAETVFTVLGLSRETGYRAVLEAEYVDPDTGRPAVTVLAEEEYLTTPPWSLSYTAIPEGTGWRYSLDAWDPEGVLGPGFWYAIRYSDETLGDGIWFGSGDVFWTDAGDGRRTGEFVSETPPSAVWTLTVTVTMVPQEGIEYPWITLLEAQITGNE